MANHPSANKRIRQTERRTARNKQVRTACRTFIKRTRRAIHAGNADDAQKFLAEARRRIDKAVSKGVFHRRTGSRTISRLSRQVHALTK